MIIIYFLLTILTSILLTLIIRQIALRYKIVDFPDNIRKKHFHPVPLMGGVAIFLSFWIVIGIAWRYYGLLSLHINSRQLFFLFLGTAVLMVVGFFDDKYKISAGVRLIFSVLAVILVLIGGMQLSGITNPFGAGTIGLDYWKISVGSWGTILVGANILMFLWLLGMMYTTKILDGLGGLSTGVVLIGAVMMAFLSNTAKFYQPDVRFLAVVFAGACLGFLVFNFYPAKIFLGEGGSLFLGLVLGVLAVISGGKIATALLVMAVPIIDLGWVIFDRLIHRQPLSHGDRRHLHFRLVDAGLSERVAVLLLYAVSFSFGITTLFLPSKLKLVALIILFVGVIMLELFLNRLSVILSKAKNPLY